MWWSCDSHVMVMWYSQDSNEDQDDENNQEQSCNCSNWSNDDDRIHSRLRCCEEQEADSNVHSVPDKEAILSWHKKSISWWSTQYIYMFIQIPHSRCQAQWQVQLYSLIPRPSPAPVFDSMQYAQTEGEGLANLTTWSTAHMTSQVKDKSYVPLEHNWVWSRTAEGWFHCKHCKPKSCFFIAMLAKFITADITCRSSNLSELSLQAKICFACLMFSVSTCLVTIASAEHKISLLPSMAIHISVTTCDVSATE